MVLKRELRRYFNRYGKFVEPFMILALVMLFILPILSVKNLTPHTGKAPELNAENLNVLGVEVGNGQPFEIYEVGGMHNYIQNEKLTKLDSGSYQFSTKILLRKAGLYNKPILQVSNPTQDDVTLELSLKDFENSSTQIGLLVDKTNFVLHDSNGLIYSHQITIKSGQNVTLYLDVRNEVAVNFNEEITLLLSPDLDLAE